MVWKTANLIIVYNVLECVCVCASVCVCVCVRVQWCANAERLRVCYTIICSNLYKFKMFKYLQLEVSCEFP